MVKPVITEFTQIAELFVQKYERYLPTAFDESMTILEKMNKIIEYLNQIGKTVNDSFIEWNKIMNWVLTDGLSETVVERLQEMMDDGTLETIINVGILGSRARIIVDEVAPLNPDEQTFWHQIVGVDPSFNLDGAMLVDGDKVTYNEVE